MSYSFNILYPANLASAQRSVMTRFPKCQYQRDAPEIAQWKVCEYSAKDASDIVSAASALRQISKDIFVGQIFHNGAAIFFHPVEQQLLGPGQKMDYRKSLHYLGQNDRLLHDYLMNIYLAL